MVGKPATTRMDDLRTGHPYWLEARGTSVRMRQMPGSERFDVVIVGAGISGALLAEALTRESVLKQKTKRILRKLESATGLKVGRAEYSWAAPFSVTKDGLPIIDRVKGHDRVFAVMGFGGNGITFSVIAAQIVTAALVGHEDPHAGLFRLR